MMPDIAGAAQASRTPQGLAVVATTSTEFKVSATK